MLESEPYILVVDLQILVVGDLLKAASSFKGALSQVGIKVKRSCLSPTQNFPQITPHQFFKKQSSKLNKNP